MDLSSISGADSLYSSIYKDKNRQKVPGNSGTADDPTSLLASTAGITPSNAVAAASANDNGSGNDAVKQFTDYMKETPAQRMQDAWLQQQGITKSQFDAMSPADQQKLLAEMKRQMEEKMKQDAGQAQKGQNADLLV